MNIKVIGRIIFDPVDKTRKHAKQSTWKKNAMVVIKDDTQAYYSWFIKKKYGITLQPSIRGAHITFLNDRASEISNYESIKRKWNHKTIEIELSLEPFIIPKKSKVY